MNQVIFVKIKKDKKKINTANFYQKINFFNGSELILKSGNIFLVTLYISGIFG